MEEHFPKKNCDKMLKYLFEGTVCDLYDKAIVNLSIGAPGPDILISCCEIFKKATSHRMEKEMSGQGLLFQYGPAVGIVEVRLGISRFLTDAYRSEVKSEDIIVTSGATNGMQIILPTLLDVRGYIFVDDITYMDALAAFRQITSLQIVPVKLNSDGVDIEALKALLEEKRFKSESKSFWGLYYTIPVYHNPTGIVFSDDVCKKLIGLAREFDILIACDDVYNTFYYRDDDIPKRLYEYDNPNDDYFKGNVISNGSFSKIIAPGLRLGWLEAPPRCKLVLEYCGVLQGGGCLNNYTSGIMASMFELGLAQTQAGLAKELYKQRLLTTIEVLKNNLPPSCSFLEPRGGLFVWIRMPESIDSNEFLKVCVSKFKVYFIPGNRFSIANRYKNYFRISIAFHKKEVLEDAILRLCKGLKEYIGNE